MESATATARAAAPSAPARAWSWLRRNALTIYAGIATVYVLIPIAVIAVFSFAETPRDTLIFAINDGFTLEYWENAFAIPDLNDALRTSFELAALSTAASTALGQPADRYADGDPGDRDRGVAALDVPDLLGPAGVHEPADRPHHVLDQLRRRGGPFPADRIRPQHRGCRRGPWGDPSRDVPIRDSAIARSRGTCRGAARVRSLGRRLHRLGLQQGHDRDVSALCLRGSPQGYSGTGERARHHALRGHRDRDHPGPVAATPGRANGVSTS